MDQNIFIVQEIETGDASAYTVRSLSELPRIRIQKARPSKFYKSNRLADLVINFGGELEHGISTKRTTLVKDNYIYVRDAETHIVYVNLDKYEGEAIAAKLALGEA